ncbi:MAG: DUF3823 domain-containing protein [Bacteroidales bacterium]|nr:DUF3823 domain-containing protein [Bacteroidales bacterium]
MKKLIYLIPVLMLVCSCDWFKLDNQEAWDASIEGKIVDSLTGETIQSEQGNALSVYELGWDNKVAQSWAIKNDGTYKNALVFSGDYEMNTVKANFVADPVNFTLKKGNNTQNFTVTPFVRISGVNISYDSSSKKINATFTVEPAFSTDKVNNIGVVRICVYPDRFVKQSANYCGNDPGAVVTNLEPKKQTVSLSVDTTLPANLQEFQYNRPHYIRIAAIGGHYTGGRLDNTFNQGYYNYSSVYRLENGVVTEVTDW